MINKNYEQKSKKWKLKKIIFSAQLWFFFKSKWEKIPALKQNTKSINYLKIKLMCWVKKPKLISLFNIFIMALDMTEKE